MGIGRGSALSWSRYSMGRDRLPPDDAREAVSFPHRVGKKSLLALIW